MDDLALAALFGLAIGGALGAAAGDRSWRCPRSLRPGHARAPGVPSLLVVGLTAAGAAAARVRVGTVWFAAAVFAAAGIGGSFVGAWVNHRLDEGLVLGGLAVVMVVASIGMAPGRPASLTWYRAVMTRAADRVTAHTSPKVIVAGLGLGVMTGLFGVGGGSSRCRSWRWCST